MAIKTEYKGHTIAVHPDGTFEVTAYGETFGSEKDARKYLDQHVASAAKKSVPLMDLIKGTHPDVLKAARLSKADRSKEGSRGGKVIGHTSSGKPIYAQKHDNPKHFKDSHAHFDHNDHRDAGRLHANLKAQRRDEMHDAKDKSQAAMADAKAKGIKLKDHAEFQEHRAKYAALHATTQYHQHMAEAHLQNAGAMRPNVNPKHVNEATRRHGDKMGHKAAQHHDDAIFTEVAKPTTQAELDATPTPAQAVGTRFKQLPKVKKSIGKGAGILQLDNVFASEDAGNQKMSKMGVSASPMTVAASEDPAIDGESPTGRGSKSFGLQYSKRVRKHYGLPD